MAESPDSAFSFLEARIELRSKFVLRAAQSDGVEPKINLAPATKGVMAESPDSAFSFLEGAN